MNDKDIYLSTLTELKSKTFSAAGTSADNELIFDIEGVNAVAIDLKAVITSGSVAIKEVSFAPADSFVSADTLTYTKDSSAVFYANDRLSNVNPFLQTSLSASGGRRLAFSIYDLASFNTPKHKKMRIRLEATGGSVSLTTNLVVLKNHLISPQVVSLA